VPLLRRGRFFEGSDATDEGVSGAWNTLADGWNRTEALALYWNVETAGYLLLGFFISVAKAGNAALINSKRVFRA
jgi:hypothetical protein